MPGGMGLCEALFAKRREWAEMALSLVASCKCEHGCPACLLSANCESMNENLSKRGTARLLSWVLGVDAR